MTNSNFCLYPLYIVKCCRMQYVGDIKILLLELLTYIFPVIRQIIFTYMYLNIYPKSQHMQRPWPWQPFYGNILKHAQYNLGPLEQICTDNGLSNSYWTFHMIVTLTFIKIINEKTQQKASHPQVISGVNMAFTLVTAKIVMS